jgi:hypothetical protein
MGANIFMVLACIWMDRFYQALAASRKFITGACRFKYTTCTFCTHHRILRLRHLSYSRLAYHHLPSLLRCGCHLLRICNGANADAVTRKVMKLEDYITISHIENMNKVIVLTGSIVGCAYLTELFMAWYSQQI